jgi:hypothetical protein
VKEMALRRLLTVFMRADSHGPEVKVPALTPGFWFIKILLPQRAAKAAH